MTTPTAAAVALRRARTRTDQGFVTDSIEGFRFNSGVARLVRVPEHAEGRAGRLPWKWASQGVLAARAEALEILARLISPFAPHLAEEAWARLGKAGMVVDAPWPKADPALAADDERVLPVQINGKRRGEIKVKAGTAEAEVENIALADRGRDGPPGGPERSQGDRGERPYRQHRGRLIHEALFPLQDPAVVARPGPAACLGCGFTPLYGPRAVTRGSAPSRWSRRRPHRLPAAREAGRRLRARRQRAAARYRLIYAVSEQRYARGVRVDNVANRFELTLTASWRLMDTKTGEAVRTGVTSAAVTYDSADQPYASIAAQQDSQERAADRTGPQDPAGTGDLARGQGQGLGPFDMILSKRPDIEPLPAGPGRRHPRRGHLRPRSRRACATAPTSWPASRSRDPTTRSTSPC